MMDQGLVEITFQLKNFKSIDGCIPGVIGNLTQLGEWRPERALKADKFPVENDCLYNKNKCTKQEYVWVCKAHIPAATEYDWSWVVFSKDGNFVAIEDNGHKRYNSLYFDKICSHGWEDKLHTTIKMSKTTLKTHYIVTNSNHHIAVLGSHPSLGCWVPGKAILAVEESKNPGFWLAECDVPQGVLILWKWVVLDSVSNLVFRWEERKNRLLFAHTDNMTAYAAWNSPEEAKIIDMFNSHQVKKRSKKKRMKERKLYTKNLQNSTVNRSIVGELYESIIDSKLPYEFRFTTHKLNEPLVHNKYCPVDATVQAGTGSGEKRFIDVTSYSTSEETLSTYVITENKDGNISIHLDPDRKSYQSQRNDSIYCCIGMPYYEQSLPMSETDERRKDHNVRRKIEDDESGYNQVESATLTKSLYDAKESLLFKLRLKKTVTSLPRGVNGYFYELDPIPSSKAHTNGPDEIVKKMKRKKIIRKEKFNKNNGCCRFTFYNNPNEDQTIFRESSADVPFAYGGVEGQSKTWDIVGLMDTDVDTGIDEEFNLHGRLKENWYDCMCRYSGFPILI